MLKRQLVKSESLSIDTSIGGTKSRVLQENQKFPEKTTIHILEQNFC